MLTYMRQVMIPSSSSLVLLIKCVMHPAECSASSPSVYMPPAGLQSLCDLVHLPPPDSVCWLLHTHMSRALQGNIADCHICSCSVNQHERFVQQKHGLACRLRVVEHNVLVISKYYSRITTKRLATLLCLKEEEVRVLCHHACTRAGHTDLPSHFFALAYL